MKSIFAVPRLALGAALLACPASAMARESADDECVAPEEEGDETVIFVLKAYPHVDQWEEGDHVGGGGAAFGVDLSPWQSALELTLDVGFLTNLDENLVTFETGMKFPVHSSDRFDFFGVSGPVVAYENRGEPGGGRRKEVVVGVLFGLGFKYWTEVDLGFGYELTYTALGGNGIAHRLYNGLTISYRI